MSALPNHRDFEIAAASIDLASEDISGVLGAVIGAPIPAEERTSPALGFAFAILLGGAFWTGVAVLAGAIGLV